MIVHRISKAKERARDLSGRGAFLYGGRWNSEGIFALYTSIYVSLAFLEILVHADESEIPPKMYLSRIEFSDDSPIYEFPDNQLPKNWREPDNLMLKRIGDSLILEKKYLGIKVRSAVLPSEYNILLNPMYADYNNLVKVMSVEELDTDTRLM